MEHSAEPAMALSPRPREQLVSTGSCDVGLFTSCMCLIASALTLVEGIIYVILLLTDLDVRFRNCAFLGNRVFIESEYSEYSDYDIPPLKEECNHAWREVFSFTPIVFFEVWTPLFLGILGASVHVQSFKFCAVFEWVLPHTYLQYAFFMLITCLFGNIGYCGQLGVILGVYSALCCAVCAIARMLRKGQIQPVQTKY